MGAATSKPYLVFGLGDESYAVPVERAVEALEPAKVTKLRTEERSYEGIINLRGQEIPLVDLRLEPGLPLSVGEGEGPIIVLELPSEERETRLVGTGVDSVREVMELDESAVEAMPRVAFGGRSAVGCVTSIWKFRLIQGGLSSGSIGFYYDMLN